MGFLRFGFMLLGLSLIIMVVWALRIPAPAWTRAWPAPPRWTAIPSSEGTVVTAKDLAGLGHRLPRGPGKAHFFLGPAVEPLDLPGLLSQMHASIRAAERAQWEAAAQTMASYLEARVAERLVAQEEIWEERLERRRRELAEGDERMLAAYAAKIRREALPDLSALQMELALCTEEKRRMRLEEELVRAMAAIEEYEGEVLEG
ncbi:MAG: hypothetical protein K6U03_09810 [Firmicutes bacterium]|nr:hypothetical protein [Bacillota bacterium]